MNSIRRAEARDIPGILKLLVQVNMVHHNGRPDLFNEVGKKYSRIITIENGAVTGGLGTAVVEYMADNGFNPVIRRMGLPDRFIEHGSTPQLLHLCHIDEDAIISTLRELTSEPTKQEQ